MLARYLEQGRLRSSMVKHTVAWPFGNLSPATCSFPSVSLVFCPHVVGWAGEGSYNCSTWLHLQSIPFLLAFQLPVPGGGGAGPAL